MHTKLSHDMNQLMFDKLVFYQLGLTKCSELACDLYLETLEIYDGKNQSEINPICQKGEIHTF